MTIRTPATWPDRAAVDAWWRDEVAAGLAEIRELDGLRTAGDSVLVAPDDPADLTRVRLVRGDHLAPGAAYALESADLDGVDATAEIGGTSGWRTAALALHTSRPVPGLAPGTGFEVHVDGLDHFTSITGSSDNPYASGRLDVTPDPGSPIVLVVKLRWLRVSADAAMDGTDLVANLRLDARGIWSPIVGPAIAVIGRFARGPITSAVEEWAARLTAIAEGRESPSRERRGAAEQDAEVSGAVAPSAPSRPLRAEDLELRWLRSPRTTWAYVKAMGVETTADATQTAQERT